MFKEVFTNGSCGIHFPCLLTCTQWKVVHTQARVYHSLFKEQKLMKFVWMCIYQLRDDFQYESPAGRHQNAISTAITMTLHLRKTNRERVNITAGRLRWQLRWLRMYQPWPQRHEWGKSHREHRDNESWTEREGRIDRRKENSLRDGSSRDSRAYCCKPVGSVDEWLSMPYFCRRRGCLPTDKSNIARHYRVVTDGSRVRRFTPRWKSHKGWELAASVVGLGRGIRWGQRCSKRGAENGRD